MRSNDAEYWNKQKEITEEVLEYSKTFVERFSLIDRKLDFSEESIVQEISYEINRYNEWDLKDSEARIYWVQLLAYFSATLCTIFKGKCLGEFPKDNPAGAYYTFRVGVNGRYLNVEDIIGRACDQQFDFVSWYKTLRM